MTNRSTSSTRRPYWPAKIMRPSAAIAKVSCVIWVWKLIFPIELNEFQVIQIHSVDSYFTKKKKINVLYGYFFICCGTTKENIPREILSQLKTFKKLILDYFINNFFLIL